MIKVAICDDDPMTVDVVKTNLLWLANKYRSIIQIEIFFDGSALLEELKDENKVFDLIYLDIEMVLVDGITTARCLREYNRESVIIYISYHESYFRELFEVEPFRFLCKPINMNLFEDYYVKALQKIKNKQVYFQFKYNKEFHKVLVKDIIYFESSKRTIIIYMSTGEKYLFYGRLNAIENDLEVCKEHFLRIHQSFLVNYSYIKIISHLQVILSNGQQLKISQEKNRQIAKRFSDLLSSSLTS